MQSLINQKINISSKFDQTFINQSGDYQEIIKQIKSFINAYKNENNAFLERHY